ncbi:MAG TPA: hypothetical protein VMA95_17660 [Streptosporangiaceae bacterium]|nr:hypothetical protein [Streptosporangiaceae bacterium]
MPVPWDSEGTLTSGDAYKFDVYTTNVIPSGDKSSAPVAVTGPILPGQHRARR